jgi:hypothetical protein
MTITRPGDSSSWPNTKKGKIVITKEDMDAMRPPITAEMVKAATGNDPTDDDLERCNCPHAGEEGHWQCGWNWEHNKPQFMFAPKINSRADSAPQPKPARFWSMD